MESSHAAESIAALPDVSGPPEAGDDAARPGLRLAACPLCGETAAAVSTARGVDLARCDACGLLRADPQPDAAALDAIYTAGYFLGDDTPEGRRGCAG